MHPGKPAKENGMTTGDPNPRMHRHRKLDERPAVPNEEPFVIPNESDSPFREQIMDDRANDAAQGRPDQFRCTPACLSRGRLQHGLSDGEWSPGDADHVDGCLRCQAIAESLIRVLEMQCHEALGPSRLAEPACDAPEVRGVVAPPTKLAALSAARRIFDALTADERDTLERIDRHYAGNVEDTVAAVARAKGDSAQALYLTLKRVVDAVANDPTVRDYLAVGDPAGEETSEEESERREKFPRSDVEVITSDPTDPDPVNLGDSGFAASIHFLFRIVRELSFPLRGV